MKKNLPIILLVVLLVGGGLFVVSRQGKNDGMGGGTVPGKATVPTDWLNYENATHGLSFQHPPDWEINVPMDKEDFLSVSLSKKDESQEIIEVYGDKMTPSYSINVTVAANPEGFSAKDFHLSQFAESSKTQEEANLKMVNYGGVKGIRFQEGAAPSSGPAIGVLLTKGTRVYRFIYMALATKDTHEKFLNVLDQLMETVKLD